MSESPKRKLEESIERFVKIIEETRKLRKE